MTNLHNDGQGNVRIEYKIPTRGLIGFRNTFLTLTRGEGLMASLFIGLRALVRRAADLRNGALVATDEGVATSFGLNIAQGRGVTFIEPGTRIYQGMIVGLSKYPMDIIVNVAKEKKLTNIRAASADIAVRLSPAVELSLEEALDFIADDELLEVTPKSLRLRKKRPLASRSRARPRPGDRGDGRGSDLPHPRRGVESAEAQRSPRGHQSTPGVSLPQRLGASARGSRPLPHPCAPATVGRPRPRRRRARCPTSGPPDRRRGRARARGSVRSRRHR